MSIWQPVSRLPVPGKEIILYCVWLYFRFGVSFRDVEEMMALRGEQVSYETVGRWCDKFGQNFARWPEAVCGARPTMCVTCACCAKRHPWRKYGPAERSRTVREPTAEIRIEFLRTTRS